MPDDCSLEVPALVARRLLFKRRCYERYFVIGSARVRRYRPEDLKSNLIVFRLSHNVNGRCCKVWATARVSRVLNLARAALANQGTLQQLIHKEKASSQPDCLEKPTSANVEGKRRQNDVALHAMLLTIDSDLILTASNTPAS